MDLAMLADVPAMYKTLTNPLTCALLMAGALIGVFAGWRRGGRD